MFQVNDVITYGAQGVCKIIGTEEKMMGGKKRNYFVLQPVREKSATIFVPMDNMLALNKMHRLLTKAQVYKLIDFMRTEDTAWEENENARRELYKSILAKGDHGELIRMIKSLYIQKKAREAAGKRLHMSDERYFKDAEQILYNEFQYVLGFDSKEELMNCIVTLLEK